MYVNGQRANRNRGFSDGLAKTGYTRTTSATLAYQRSNGQEHPRQTVRSRSNAATPRPLRRNSDSGRRAKSASCGPCKSPENVVTLRRLGRHTRALTQARGQSHRNFRWPRRRPRGVRLRSRRRYYYCNWARSWTQSASGGTPASLHPSPLRCMRALCFACPAAPKGPHNVPLGI